MSNRQRIAIARMIADMTVEQIMAADGVSADQAAVLREDARTAVHDWNCYRDSQD